MALSKANRLRHRRDFTAVYQSGVRRNTTHLTLRALRSPLGGATGVGTGKVPTRIGISISLKVSKQAVIRNRIKRRIRAAFRCLLPRLSPGWRLVLVVRPTAVECDYGQILRELEQLLAQAEVLDGD
ncbi:ribonuclease P protein component [Funiculus sociatus GB2-A5]|uniref:Ribonuclease P protein component n=1 Tax=Funiculus sociatus GB2-A5 TaxID=2933946 RepID=A0ABV0JNN7_9CYAN|nr:ribonuclease P protein component [Trichocoleus sp. FACHB-832]MBD2065297.1 ribonuclease P protein component [Trichocoleus sp. FACHB-6]